MASVQAPIEVKIDHRGFFVAEYTHPGKWKNHVRILHLSSLYDIIQAINLFPCLRPGNVGGILLKTFVCNKFAIVT